MAKNLRSLKREIRVVGVDDGFFVPHTTGLCDVIGVVFRGGYWLDGFMRTRVEIDGMDATDKIADMIVKSPHCGQLRIVLLDGITFAGFNVVDTERLYELTDLPVIGVTRVKPDFEDIKLAIRNLPFADERWKTVCKADKVVKVYTRTGQNPVFMQVTGVEVEFARELLKATSTRSNVPEALRVAHIIASGLTSPPQ